MCSIIKKQDAVDHSTQEHCLLVRRAEGKNIPLVFYDRISSVCSSRERAALCDYGRAI